jgi:hypothetical protein
MIPKTIHYCWFGCAPLSSLALKCIESWKEHCPNYEIKEWNESNFDININKYMSEAYEVKKWAFVSDVARLWVILNNGGVYLDTDVEIIKPIDELLNNDMFIGFENYDYLNTGLGFGAVKNFYLIKKMLDIYNDLLFIKSDGCFNTIPCPVYNTEIMKQEGFIINNTKQIMNNVLVLPKEYLCPKDGLTGIINQTENTFSIHHYDSSWYAEDKKKEYMIITKYRKKYGIKLGSFLYAFVAILTFRRSGINNILKKYFKKGEK